MFKAISRDKLVVSLITKFVRLFKHYLLNFQDNSNVPDTDLMWQDFSSKPTEIACRLVRGEVCAKVSYSFNGAGE